MPRGFQVTSASSLPQDEETGERIMRKHMCMSALARASWFRWRRCRRPPSRWTACGCRSPSTSTSASASSARRLHRQVDDDDEQLLRISGDNARAATTTNYATEAATARGARGSSPQVRRPVLPRAVWGRTARRNDHTSRSASATCARRPARGARHRPRREMEVVTVARFETKSFGTERGLHDPEGVSLTPSPDLKLNHRPTLSFNRGGGTNPFRCRRPKNFGLSSEQ